MLLCQLEQVTADLRLKTESVNELQKDKTAKLLSLESKCEQVEQEMLQLRSNVDTFKKTCKEQETKIESLMTKLKRTTEERLEVENNMQQELSVQTRLVQLYKDDRDHAKSKLEEVTCAVTELQELLKQLNEEKTTLEGKLQAEEEEHTKIITELKKKLEEQSVELENANDLLQLSKIKGNNVAPDDLSILSPMAAQTSKILKKGMTLTQIYSEYVKVSDEFLNERDENARLKLYMEQILKEVEEKAPLLMKQKEDYEYARRTIDSMSIKMEENIKECRRLQNEQQEYERKVNFHKREEKRLKILCTDLSRQVRVLLKEVEEARGGVVSSSETLPELLPSDSMNTSSSGQVISEHLVTFRSISELQSQNERLLLTVRELSEEQEKLEQEGGPDIIKELKKKIEAAKSDLDALRENQKTQDDMMDKLCRQRDMYKVLAQKGGIMVGDVSSTSALGTKSIELETELTKARVELDSTVITLSKLKETSAAREKTLNEKVAKQGEELYAIKLEHDRLKNKLEFAEERNAIVATTADGYKREVSALESKCKSVTEALTKVRVEAEKYKQEYHEAKEKLLAAEVNIKTSETEKHLIKEAEKRLMQENQSLLDQQRSQNVLLTNLQSIQNNLERQEFETRKSFSKQVDILQREIRALRRQGDTDMQLLKVTNSSLEKELKELKIKLAIELEKNMSKLGEVESSKQQIESLETKCNELQAQYDAADKRLNDILQSDSNEKVKEDYEHEKERHKTKVRELELVVSNALSEKKAIEDQLEISRKHLQQYQEIANSNEHAIKAVNEKLDAQTKEYEKRLTDANDMARSLKSQIATVVAEKMALKKSSELAEEQLTATINELRTQSAPLERRLQEVTRALVTAKELETAAVKESQLQVQIAKEATNKYERELVLHAQDVEQLTLLKEELQTSTSRYGGMEERLSEIQQTLESNEQLMKQMKEHHSKELREGELARKDLIDQNAILHGQVEKLSVQLAAAKSQNKDERGSFEISTDKSLDEVYELLRFVRREKEISETKAEAAETESMRYRQRAEHLQRDLDETKAALEFEMERTKGRMLTEDEHKDVMEKVKKAKEYEELNKHLEKEKAENLNKIKSFLDKIQKLEADLKPLEETKKSLENEKNSWIAEKTALKTEIERWTNRTNQLMAQNVKSDGEELKKLQSLKIQNEKQITAMQEDLKRTKQQLDAVRRESLKLKSEKTENQNKIQSLQSELVAAQSNVNKGTTTTTTAAATATIPKVDSEQLNALEKENEEIKMNLESKTAEIADKTNMIQQLRKVARKYKNMSDKLQSLLADNNIDFSAIVKAPVGSAADADQAGSKSSAALDPEEKKKIETLLEEKTKALELLTQTFNELQQKYNTEKGAASDREAKFEEMRNCYVESEKRLSQFNKENESLKKELKEEKGKQEKNKKLIKTAKDKISSLNKLKEASSQEVDTLSKQNAELQKKLEQASLSNKQIDLITKDLQDQVVALQKRVDELMNEKNTLTAKMEQLQALNERMQEAKRQAVKANQQKSRLQSSGTSTEMSQTAETSALPLTATVRPTATSSQVTSTKYHPQTATPTASIRPLAHAAPTAIINRTMPIAQTSIVPTASVSALPISVLVQPQPTEVLISAVVQPQIAEVPARLTTEHQGRVGTSRPLGRAGFNAPIVRVHSQDTTVMDDLVNVVPNIDDQPEAGSSSSTSDVRPTSKRSRAHIEGTTEEIEDSIDPTDGNQEEPGSKRQRVEPSQEQSIEDSQESLEEDELLGEGNEDDDVMNAPTQSYQPPAVMLTLRESHLQTERSLQPSPQELLRHRSSVRGRSQLPSFSLLSGHGGGGFYEETDDSTVPSTPTLYMPKRTDGFAEAVSSPLIRFPTFSFATNEQTPSLTTIAPALEQTGVHLGETRVDLMISDDHANVPQTPLSIVPSVHTSEHLSTQAKEEGDVRHDNFYSEDHGQEQNVPQQVDLTEEDEEDDRDKEEDDDDDGDDEDDEDDNFDDHVDDGGDADNYDNDDDDEEEREEEAEEEEAMSKDVPTLKEESEDEIIEIYVDEDAPAEEENESGSESSRESNDIEGNIEEIEDQEEQVGKVNERIDDIIEINAEESLDAEYPNNEGVVTATEHGAEQPMSIPGEEKEGDDDIAIDETSARESNSEMMEDQVLSSVEARQSQETKAEDVDKPKPVRLQRTRGVRTLIRRKVPIRQTTANK